VLVADDDPLARSLVASVVGRTNADVIEVADGEAAWTELRKGQFAAAILDLEMPGFDGFEIIGCIRGYPPTAHLPIIVVSSRDDKVAIDRALQSGATSYITKPVHWTAFSSHIGYLLDLSRRAERAEAAVAKTVADAHRNASEQATALSRLARRLDLIADQAAGGDTSTVLAECRDVANGLRKLAIDFAPSAPNTAHRPSVVAAE
jgi:CheY-like chemotaxis protein